MSDYELAIKRCKRLEEILEQSLGASGRGLHEKVSSVEPKLSPPLVKKLRFIATVRNRLVHETSIDRLDDRDGFERACNEAEQQLVERAKPITISKKGCLVFLAAVGSFAALAASVLVLFLQ